MGVRTKREIADLLARLDDVERRDREAFGVVFPDAVEAERRQGIRRALRWIAGRTDAPLTDGPITYGRAVAEARLARTLIPNGVAPGRHVRRTGPRFPLTEGEVLGVAQTLEYALGLEGAVVELDTISVEQRAA